MSAIQQVLCGLNQSPSDITTGLVGWWKLNDGSGTTASDSIGSNNLSMVSSPVWVSNGAGFALQFDGVDDEIHNLSYSDPITNYPLTIACWFKTPTTLTTVYILDFGSDNAGTYRRFRIYSNGFAEAQFRNNLNKGITIQRPSSIIANAWHLMVSVETSATARSLYVNGSSSPFNNTTDISAYATSSNSTYFFNKAHVGASPTNSSFFASIMDDVRIYNRTLSTTEIDTLYSNGPR